MCRTLGLLFARGAAWQGQHPAVLFRHSATNANCVFPRNISLGQKELFYEHHPYLCSRALHLSCPLQDIFRKYPSRYEGVIGTLCENLDTLDEPEAKASMIWIIGEYAERIESADELLETFLESFPEEASMVQLQLLTATVKLFLKRPTETVQKMISLVLSCATNDTDNPDLRDRAYVYWRLLSTDPEVSLSLPFAQLGVF